MNFIISHNFHATVTIVREREREREKRGMGEDGYPPTRALQLCLSVSMGREIFLKCVIAGTIIEADCLK